jgi:DNA-directed RNA polymerase II subunit RPB2
MQKHVVDALFRDVSLTAQAINSYDDFVSRIVPKVVKNHRPLELRSEFAPESPLHVIKLENVRYGVPSCMEKNNDIRRYTPMEARNRDLMYSAPMFVDIHYTHCNKTGDRATQIFNEVYLARMPVMFRSSLCSSERDKDFENGECPHDPGGYFIVNGREKTLVVQERISPNIMFCFSPNECLYHAEYDPIAHRVATLRIKTRKFGSSPYRVSLPGFEIEIPIVILFRALGDIENKWQLYIDKEDFRQSMQDASCAKTQKEALAWLGKYTQDPVLAIQRQVYPNVAVERKCLQLALQWKKYLDCLHKRCKFDDRDHIRAKRLDTAGAMLGSMFSHLFYQLLGTIRKQAVALLNKNKRLRPHRLIQPQHITDGIKYALATGNWKIKSSAFAGRVGVSQLLNRNTYISCISQLRRVDTGIDSQQKIIAPRLLYGNQWGYMCPSETPEGGPCGLVKQLSLSAYITTQCEQKKILEIVAQSLEEDGRWFVFHNGAPIGTTNDTQLAEKLRNARRVRTISSDVCVAVEDEHIHIWTDSGRVSRPVFVVKDGSVVISDEQVNDLKDGRLHWKDLFTLGVVENLSVYEEEAAYIALSPDAVTSEHTHCELDPSLILGTLASTIPYPDHNQSPRNVYQAAMGKQAMGIYASNYAKRFDTNGHVMDYPQKPLVTTRAAKALCGDELPAGTQAIVAIMCFGGYNQEDSLLFNKSAIDRGMFRSTTYRTYSSSNSSTRQSPASEFKKEEMYGGVTSTLDADGLAFPNTRIEKGKAIFCNVTAGKKHPHVTKNKKSSGVVDSTILFQNANGGQTAKTRIREQRIPQIGDKFSSRHGQKGTMGMMYRQEDLPFTAEGIVPDLIVNPHAIPSRMTIGHVFECVASKLASLLGVRVDATAFSHDSVETVCAMLKKAGYSEDGKEVMYHPFTGKRMKGRVFIGPTFYQRLKHMVEDKIHARAKGKIVGLTRQPVDGRANGGGLRWGEMERDCGVAHGAAAVLHERMMISSDKYDAPICEKCGLIGTVIQNETFEPMKCGMCGETKVHMIQMPYAGKLMIQELMAMGISPKLVIKESIR